MGKEKKIDISIMKVLPKETISPVKGRKAFNSLKFKKAAAGKLRGISKNKPLSRRISHRVAECFTADETCHASLLFACQ